jgi:hypothetical protein
MQLSSLCLLYFYKNHKCNYEHHVCHISIIGRYQFVAEIFYAACTEDKNI